MRCSQFDTNMVSISWTTEQHSKIPKSLCEMGKTCKYSPRSTPKNPNFESWMNWEKLLPNLSFTENKMGNLHKIRRFTFQTK